MSLGFRRASSPIHVVVLEDGGMVIGGNLQALAWAVIEREPLADMANFMMHESGITTLRVRYIGSVDAPISSSRVEEYDVIPFRYEGEP